MKARSRSLDERDREPRSPVGGFDQAEVIPCADLASLRVGAVPGDEMGPGDDLFVNQGRDEATPQVEDAQCCVTGGADRESDRCGGVERRQPCLDEALIMGGSGASSQAG